MTHDEFSGIAAKYGFKRVYFLSPARFPPGENRSHLTLDAQEEFPFADSIAVLVYPYAPFTAGERIPAYYLASNKAYFGMKAMLGELNGLGVHAEKIEIPLKQALEEAGIGVELKTSLRAIPPYGTRTVLMTIAVEGIPPLSYDERIPSPCAVCRRCEEACPVHAPGRNGLDLSRCMRPQMETACHPDSVRDKQVTFIGCEICQYACPMNALLDREEPAEEVRDIFSILRLASGDTKSARALVGKNMTSSGKLTAEAIAFAARDGLIDKSTLEALLASADASPFEAVRDAARYARSKLD